MKAQHCSTRRVHKGNFGSVKQQAIGGSSVEIIPDDGHTQTLWVSGMNTQLVGSASDGKKVDAGLARSSLDHLVQCARSFTMLVADQLPRAIFQINSEWQINNALLLIHLPV